MDRRTTLAEAATDYVLEHGLIGLSLRPLATAVGTSDRMLLYHFRDKDDLVATILRLSTERSVRGVRSLPVEPSPGAAVRALWEAVTEPAQLACQRTYVEAAALGLLGREPYARVVAESNAAWTAALADYFAAAGVPGPQAGGVADLVEAAFMGLLLDRPLDTEEHQRGIVERLAVAVDRAQRRSS